MSTGWLVALAVLVVVALYLVAGTTVARHESRRLYSVNVRYVKHQRSYKARDARDYDAPLTELETARVFREIRKDQREILGFWPAVALGNVATWNRARRKAKLGASGGWMLAGARVAEAELASARAALEVWGRERESGDGVHRQIATEAVEAAEQTIKRLEGRR